MLGLLFFLGFFPLVGSLLGLRAAIPLGLFFFLGLFTAIPAVILGRRALGEIRQSEGRLRGKGNAVAGIILGVIGFLYTMIVVLVLPARNIPREAARQSWCGNNLKHIGLALHNYHEAFRCLPPAAITDANGRALLSWRVAILPFIEQQALYEQFHLDEPWYSPHNRVLIDQMPFFYVCPTDNLNNNFLKTGLTGYQAIVGSETGFTPDFQPVRFEDITDGTENTVLIGETRRFVPWTEPDDLHFELSGPLSGLGSMHGYDSDGFNVLFADGSSRFLKSSIRPAVLRALLTRDGGETVSPEDY